MERKDVPGGEMARAETGRVDHIWQVTWSHKLGWKQIPLCGGKRGRDGRGGSLNAKARSPQLNLVGTGHHRQSLTGKNGLIAVGFVFFVFFFGHTA